MSGVGCCSNAKITAFAAHLYVSYGIYMIYYCESAFFILTAYMIYAKICLSFFEDKTVRYEGVRLRYINIITALFRGSHMFV